MRETLAGLIAGGALAALLLLGCLAAAQPSCAGVYWFSDQWQYVCRGRPVPALGRDDSPQAQHANQDCAEYQTHLDSYHCVTPVIEGAHHGNR